MVNAVLTLVMVGLLLMAVAVVGGAGFKTVSTVDDKWERMSSRYGDMGRTAIAIESATLDAPSSTVTATVRNTGAVPLLDFRRWDVWVQYYDSVDAYHQDWKEYTAADPPADNQWDLEGIYVSAPATPEAFGPGILDPGEEAVIVLKVALQAHASRLGRVVVGTPNGVTTSAMF